MKLCCCLTVSLTILITIGVVEFKSWIDGVSRTDTKPLSVQKRTQFERFTTTAVVLVSEGKSGSTVLGELFNQQPHAFYLFEPLNSPTLWDHHVEILERLLLECDIDADLMKAIAWGYAARKMRWFRDNFTRKPKTSTYSTRNITLARKICREAPVRAAKVIRLDDIPGLIRLSDERADQIRIVHLVRDPRAVLVSRLKKKWIARDPTSFEAQARHLCSHLMRKSDSFSQSSRNVMLIRYEDWARNPHTTNKNIMTWLGLKYDNALQTAMAKVTDADAHRLRDRRRMNLTASVSEWRTFLSASEITSANRVCSDILVRYGYVW